MTYSLIHLSNVTINRSAIAFIAWRWTEDEGMPVFARIYFVDDSENICNIPFESPDYQTLKASLGPKTLNQ
jgi:hypothetical protein